MKAAIHKEMLIFLGMNKQYWVRPVMM